MALAALLFASAPNPDAVLARMSAYLEKPFSVAITVTREHLPGVGTGTLTVQKPNRMNFRLQWLGDDYEVGWSENRTTEIVRNLKTYFESGPFARLYQPDSHLTDAAKLGFPLVLLVGDVRTIYAGVPLKLIGKDTIQGLSCDHVRGGTGEGFDVWVAADGRPMRYRFDDTDPQGTVSVKFEFSKWASAANAPLSLFEPTIPAGFRPHALPRDPYPRQPGSPFPPDGWVGADGKTAALKFEKPTLIVVTAPDCESSGRAALAMKDLESSVAIWTFSDSGRVPSALTRYPSYRDRNQRTLPRLQVPGTPLFFLVGTDGRIKKVWLGFSRAQSAKFVSEVKAAATG